MDRKCTTMYSPIFPQEVKVYCKLIKTFGIEKYFDEIEQIDPANHYVQVVC